MDNNKKEYKNQNVGLMNEEVIINTDTMDVSQVMQEYPLHVLSSEETQVDEEIHHLSTEPVEESLTHDPFLEETVYPETTESSPSILPPQSLELEQFLLGAVLLDASCVDRLEVSLYPEDFYKKEHKEIWTHIMDLFQKDSSVDAVTVYESIINKNKDTEITLEYLTLLAQNSISTASVKSYVEILKDKSILRQIIETSGAIREMCYTPEGRTAQDILDEADARMYKILDARESGGDSRIKRLVEVAQTVIEQLEIKHREAQAGKLSTLGVPTGFVDLDHKLSGLQEGQLIIVAGRPAMGKTSFAMNMVEHIGVTLGKPVMVFSMEMSAEQLATRMLASIARVNQQKMRDTSLESQDWAFLTQSLNTMLRSNVVIDESTGLNPMDIRAKTRRWARRNNNDVGLIVVDYLQLMSGSSRNVNNRATEVSEITRALKNLAREIRCPIVALSQLNRTLESRTNKRPMMSDLRESGAIEQDADVILFIYRDEVYHPDTADKGLAEIIIGKQRNGPIGTVKLSFNGSSTRFDNLALSDM